eukprot:jgi/Picre1/29579/NNA_004964.t1
MSTTRSLSSCLSAWHSMMPRLVPKPFNLRSSGKVLCLHRGALLAESRGSISPGLSSGYNFSSRLTFVGISRPSVSTSATSRTYPYEPLEIPFEPESFPTIGENSGGYETWNGDLLVVGCYEEDFECGDGDDEKVSIKSDLLKSMDSSYDNAVSQLVTKFGFKGSQGASQCCWLGKNAMSLCLVGLGSKECKDPGSVWKGLGKSIASAAKSQKAETVGVVLTVDQSIDSRAGEHVANGIVNGAYEATRFKSKSTKPSARKIDLFFSSGSMSESIAKGVALAKGSLFTRYLVEAPPNVCTPSYLASAASHIASLCPARMSLKVLEKEDCEELGMGLYLGVAEASKEAPKFIHLTYTPEGEVKRKIAIVGKGLTFDAGGYNLKAGAGSMIEMMKFDMGGSGATLGAARAIADLKPADVEIHFIIASCENMIDGRGLRPGDILVASNGKTVEVNNTDAEGRLTLADAILYAQKNCQAEYIVDIATLTGACMIALGGTLVGCMHPPILWLSN